MATASLSATASGSAGLGIPADDQSPFAREKAAFESQRGRLGKYAGQFVAVHRGRVCDSDTSRNVLVRRFFHEHGESASLYIGFIGQRRSVRIPIPITRRVI